MRLRKPCEHVDDDHPEGRYEPHTYFMDVPILHDCPGGEFLPEGALVIEKDAESIETAAEALYYWDADSGSVLIPWRYENEAPHKESNRDYYRKGAQEVLDALASQVGESE